MQSIGFIGVFQVNSKSLTFAKADILCHSQEKATMFRRYTTLHILLTVAAFAVSLTWIIISASSHSHAVNTCKKNFFANDTSTAASDVSTSGEDQTLCNIFTWTDVGLMGGLWVVLAIMQVCDTRHSPQHNIDEACDARSSIFTPSFRPTVLVNG